MRSIHAGRQGAEARICRLLSLQHLRNRAFLPPWLVTESDSRRKFPFLTGAVAESVAFSKQLNFCNIHIEIAPLLFWRCSCEQLVTCRIFFTPCSGKQVTLQNQSHYLAAFLQHRFNQLICHSPVEPEYLSRQSLSGHGTAHDFTYRAFRQFQKSCRIGVSHAAVWKTGGLFRIDS